MKYRSRAMLPVCALAAFALATCDSVDAVVNPPPPQVSIRFVNAIEDAQGNLLLTADNIPVGTALAFGAAAAMCTAIDTGTTNLAFGIVNTFDTGIATPLGSLTHNFSAAGDFTVIATGSAASPQLLVFNDEPVTTPPAGNAAVRFVIAVAGTAALDVFATAPFAIRTTPVATNLTFGTTTNAFVNVPVGSTQITFTRTGTTDDVVFVAPTLLTLTAGDVRNVVLVPIATGMSEFQTITVQRC